MPDPDLAPVQKALQPVVPAPVAHYTSLATLPFLLPTTGKDWCSAWATPVQFLNDRLELTYGLEKLRDVANQPPRSSRGVRAIIDSLLDTLGRSQLDAFQMSFSGNSDDLGQWRGYAANGMGCAVVTEALDVLQVADVAGRVFYDNKEQHAFAAKIKDALRNRPIDLTLERIIVAAACFMKDPGFSVEEEFRLVRFANPAQVDYRTAGERLVPYIDYLKSTRASLPVKEVIIGPGWQLHSIQNPELARHHVVLGVRRLLDGRGLTTVPVTRSKIPYDPR